MNEKPPPVVLAMIICDMIIRDELSKKLSLIGVFSVIHGAQVPLVLGGGMHLYVALTDGRGEYQNRVAIRHLETDQVVFQAEGPLMFQNPQQVVELNLRLPQVQFPAWGAYEITLHCDNQQIGSRTFMVRPLPPAP